MSTFTICGKRLITDIQTAQSNPKAATLNETMYAILSDSENFLQRRIRSDFEDGVPATVAIRRPPFNCATGTDCEDNDPLCQTTGTPVPPVRWETFDIDQCLSSTAYTISPEDYELACRGTLSQAFLDAAEMASDEIKRGMNIRAKAFLLANVGIWVDGSLTKEMPIAASTTGQGLYPTWRNVQEQFASVGITTKPNVIGGSPIYQIMPLYRTINPLTGFSSGMAGDVTMYYEPLFSDPNVTPANQIIAWSPQTVQIVTYNKFLKGFAQGTDVKSVSDIEKVWFEGRVRSTGAIPILFYTNNDMNAAPIRVWAEFEGIPDNCGNFKFVLTLRYKFLTVLTDLCGATGFNGIITLTTCNPVTLTCPTDPITPVVPTLYCFAWDDVPCENPYEITSVTLGTRTYTGVPMSYDGNLATLVTIINSYVGSSVLTYNAVTANIETLLPISGGSLNGGNYPFTFSECPGS